MAWVPPNYRSKSASKDRGDDSVFKYIKKKKGQKASNKLVGFQSLVKGGIKKIGK